MPGIRRHRDIVSRRVRAGRLMIAVRLALQDLRPAAGQVIPPEPGACG